MNSSNQFRTKSEKTTGGPIITISRECGCSAKRIATKLSMILSGYAYQSSYVEAKPWHWVCKEIVDQSAKNLEVNPSKIKDVFLGEAKKRISQVKTAFTLDPIYNPDDHQVIEAVEQTIMDYIQQGNYIIVGRGAEALATNLPKKLAIKLIAPYKWRVEQIMSLSNLTKHEAQIYLEQTDTSRQLFTEHIAGRKIANTDYDIIFNYATLTDDEIVESIVNVLKRKEII
jgi:cytidylate kinase